jgi:hypothetical protein
MRDLLDSFDEKDAMGALFGATLWSLFYGLLIVAGLARMNVPTLNAGLHRPAVQRGGYLTAAAMMRQRAQRVRLIRFPPKYSSAKAKPSE